jgi:hypothetical protein
MGSSDDTLAMMQAIPSGKPEGRMPKWDEKAKYFATRRALQILILLVVVIWLVLLAWVFFIAQVAKADVRPLEAGVDLTITLAPVLAAAAGVERLLETIFNMIEGSWRTLVAYMGYGMRWLKSAEAERAQARQWLASVSTLMNGTSNQFNQQMDGLLKQAEDPNNPANPLANLTPELQQKMDDLAKEAADKLDAAKRLLQDAEQRLGAAEDKLGGVTSSDGYKSAKAAASVVLGFMLGVVVAAIGQLQMFAMLGIAAVPARIDVFVTGLIIGGGSYPVHSLVGILQQGKDTLDSVKGYFNRSAPSGQAVQQRITTMQPSTAAGEPARLQQALVETTTAQTTDEGPHK